MIRNPIQRTLKRFHIPPCPSTISHTKVHPRYSGFQWGISPEQSGGPFFGGARRYYQVARHRDIHFWNNPTLTFAAVLIGTGTVVSVYYGNLETVPYTNRRHVVILSTDQEKRVGKNIFAKEKKKYKGKILPAEHPDSVRVILIANDIINALKRGLSKDETWSDLGYLSDSPESHKTSDHKTLMTSGENSAILDDKQVQKSSISEKKNLVAQHVEAFEWEIVVVDKGIVNAFCAPGGKIVVFTGLLKKFKSDNEIATILGHEVAHALARHVAERITKYLWFFIVHVILFLICQDVNLANQTMKYILHLPFSRKMEMEADYIGLLLMASAGYDPQVAPGVFEKLNESDSKLDDYTSTHPSGKKRAKLLSRSKVMEEALHLYREATERRRIEGLLQEN